MSDDRDFDGFDWSLVPHAENLWLVLEWPHRWVDEHRCVLVAAKDDGITGKPLRYYVLADSVRHTRELRTYLLGYDLFPTREEALGALLLRARIARDDAAQLVERLEKRQQGEGG